MIARVVLLVAAASSPALAQRAIVVSPDGAHRTIAAGVAAAHEGDTVAIRAGLYREPTVVVDKRVVLTGDPGAVIDGEGKRALLLVTADDVLDLMLPESMRQHLPRLFS